VRIDVLTLFPEAIEPFTNASIIGRAQRAGIVTIRYTNIRDFATDRHRSVDDRPFGGGPGMVMMCPPVFDAVEHVESEDLTPATRILLTPQGEPFNQEIAGQLAAESRLLLICGHYEGFDERIRLGLQPRELSLGDYVLSGGEPAAMVVVDAVVRLLPGALGDEESTENESFSAGLLEYPQYTRPREYRGMPVPEIVLSGDHARIEQWRKVQALRRTRERRPDLYEKIIRAQPDLLRLIEGA
jgi:tRNA (guanine37-N1)-methyltransferase